MMFVDHGPVSSLRNRNQFRFLERKKRKNKSARDVLDWLNGVSIRRRKADERTHAPLQKSMSCSVLPFAIASSLRGECTEAKRDLKYVFSNQYLYLLKTLYF
jgi:hypothetical protein